jgi:regulator of RNase E activity RraA
MGESIGDAVLRRFEKIRTATLSDAIAKAGFHSPEQLIIGDVHPMHPNSRIVVGRARTQRRVLIRDAERLTQAINPALSESFTDQAKPGDFLVVTAPHGPQSAIFGGILALTAKLRGAVGVIVDGATRDVQQANDYGLPVWARSVTPLAGGYSGYSILEVDVPINCGGVEIIPGDIIVADGDGVVVVPANKAENILDLAEAIQAAEDASARALIEGKSVRESNAARKFVWDSHRRDESKEKV